MTGPRAETLLDDSRFHQTFSLPADPSSGRPTPFTIKYADHGYRNEAHPEQERILLFYSPLMASRLLLVTKDRLAIKHKIRIICPDRPGVGGTDPADAKDRLGLWREAIPALLSHLSIPHLHAIAAHSGGTVYALDQLLHRPDLLLPSSDPSHPTTCLALGAPWILPGETGSVPLGLLKEWVPAALIRKTDVLVRMVNAVVAPVVGLSTMGSGTTAVVVTPARGQGGDGAGGGVEQQEEDGEEGKEEEVKWEERVWSGVMRQVYAEGVKGISEEALLLLRKGEDMGRGWGGWGEYDELVTQLGTALELARRRLKVRVFYAEKDLLTGDGGAASKGAKWFDACWSGPGYSGDYQSRTVQGADHDTIWGLRWGAIQELFESVGDPGQAT